LPTGNPFPTSIPQGPVVRTASDKGTTPEEYKFAEEYLIKLANLTGGSIYHASSFVNLNSAF